MRTAAVSALAILLVASSARAAMPATTLDLQRDRGVLWAEAELGEGQATTIKIKFYAPRRNAPQRRELWQVCKLPFAGAGVYRCGIDVSKGSPARRRQGVWTVKALVDDTLVAKKRFSL